MLCYKDKSWCPNEISKDCIKRVECPDVPTTLDMMSAERANLPLSFISYPFEDDKPECFEEKS